MEVGSIGRRMLIMQIVLHGVRGRILSEIDCAFLPAKVLIQATIRR